MSKKIVTARPSFQGDVGFMKIDALPAGVTPVAPEKGRVIVTHSETGNHHAMEADRVTMYRLPESLYEAFLVVKETAEITHHRPHNTHAALTFDPGVYRVFRQREYTPEGWRRVED